MKQLSLHIYLLYFHTLVGRQHSAELTGLMARIQDRAQLVSELDYSSKRSLHLLARIYQRLGRWPGPLPISQDDFARPLALFAESKLGEYLDEFVYFLFLRKIEKNVETEDGIVVHFRQEDKAVLCLDENFIMSYWGNQKGVVSLAKKLLLFDHKEVILLNTNRFDAFAKKNCKMHYLRKFINHFAKDFKQKEEYYDASYI